MKSARCFVGSIPCSPFPSNTTLVAGESSAQGFDSSMTLSGPDRAVNVSIKYIKVPSLQIKAFRTL